MIVEACSDLEEGQNCSYATARSSIRIGKCHFVGPTNHSVLACVGTDFDLPDPACQLGLFHSSSKACCASHCDICHEAANMAADEACSVDYILRLAPFCSVAAAPCVVGHSFEMPVHEAVRTEAPIPIFSEFSEPEASFPPWLTELLLPLATGFIACSCSLALCCYGLREARSWNAWNTTIRTRTPTSPPSNARVVGKTRARPKERRRRRAVRRAVPRSPDHPEENPDELPALLELDPSNEMQMADTAEASEPYPLVDIWASPNEIEAAESEGLQEAPQAETDQVHPELDAKPASSRVRSAWHLKWKDMEADLEAALTGPEAVHDIPQVPHSIGRRPKPKRQANPKKDTGPFGRKISIICLVTSFFEKISRKE